MKKQIFLIAMLIAFAGVNVTGQNNWQVKSRPYKYELPVKNVNLSKVENQPDISGDVWIVLSDRDNNFTYLSPNGEKSGKRASFLQTFFVVDEINNWIHIVKDDNFDFLGIRFSNQAEDYYWVEKKKMLLWRNCLVTDLKSKLSFKAMTANASDLTEKTDSDKINIAEFYNSPNLKSKVINEVQMFNMYYVYKISEDNKSYLLGKASRITNLNNPKQVVVGWVNKNKILEWNTRLAIEPNFTPQEAIKRKRYNIKTAIFLGPEEAINYKKNGNSDNAFWNNDSYEKRKPGNWMRFPYIKYNKESDLMTVIANNSTYRYNKKGYTPKTIVMNNDTINLYKYMVLMSQPELSDLKNTLEKFNTALNVDELRNGLRDVYIEVLKRISGEDFLKNKNLSGWSELISVLYGIPENEHKGIIFREYTLCDIDNFSSEKLKRYSEQISRSANILQGIFNEGPRYPYSFETADQTYYWIDVEYLP